MSEWLIDKSGTIAIDGRDATRQEIAARMMRDGRLRREAEARVEELEAALGHVLAHARLDLSERGVTEAERYVGLAENALAQQEDTDGE